MSFIAVLSLGAGYLPRAEAQISHAQAGPTVLPAIPSAKEMKDAQALPTLPPASPASTASAAVTSHENGSSVENLTSPSSFFSSPEFGIWKFGADLNFEVPLPLENGGLPQNRLTTREASLHAHGMIDSSYETYVDLRAHDDTGSFLFEMREGWVSTHLDDSHRHGFKIGKFALNLDQVNTMRPFERPFITSAAGQSAFYAKDQEVDSGLEYHFDLPFSDRTHFNVFAGITAGYCFGDCTPLNNGERPMVPVYYLHPSLESKWSDSLTATGLTYLGYTDVDATSTQLIGLDQLWTSGHTERGSFVNTKWLVLSELYFRSRHPSALPTQTQEGGFVLVGRALNARLSANLRLEVFTEPSLRDNDGNKRSNFAEGISPFVSYSLTPHVQLRGQYSWSQASMSSSNTEIAQAFAFQLVANLGEPDSRSDSQVSSQTKTYAGVQLNDASSAIGSAKPDAK